MMLKHAVEPLMEATGKLYGGRVPQICAGMRNTSATSTTTCTASTRRSRASATC